MLFSSLIFLYAFLPLVMLFAWSAGQKYRNQVLLVFSLIFYAWGGVSYTLIIILSIVFNYFMGRAIHSAPDDAKSKRFLAWCITGNLLALVVIKYSPFMVHNLNTLIGWFGVHPMGIPKIKLIPGISFFTFHSISYAADIYRKESLPQKNIFTMGLYIAFFPQLIAGPIIRYHEIADQFSTRKVTFESVAEGMKRFMIGLAKKVIFSNTFAYPADKIFAESPAQLDTPVAWFGILCYTLHIYCDFSGYSDMAIGLGRIFGFTFPENFNFPYRAKSIQDFWHRWHMTLSRWFRDYVYIPLGGNRISPARTYFNLMLVFFLTGFWHGASWNMVVWGLFHGTFLLIERAGFKKILPRLYVLNHVYTLLVVIVAWVFFRSVNLGYAIGFIGKMFGMGPHVDVPMHPFSIYLTKDFAWCAIIAVLFSTGWFHDLSTWLQGKRSGSALISAVRPVEYLATFAMLFVSTLFLIHQGYNPFIYFQF